jgi:hypothetical protein
MRTRRRGIGVSLVQPNRPDDSGRETSGDLAERRAAGG